MDTLDNALQLLNNNVQIAVVLISGLKETFDKETLPASGVRVKPITNQSALDQISAENLPTSCGGLLTHDQTQWKEFFTTLEPLQNQCLKAGRQLIAVLSEIRMSDSQGAPNRRQLHSQHRALTRALMDTELQSLRRTGANIILRLQEQARKISRRKETKKAVPEHSSRSSCRDFTAEDPCRPPEHVMIRLNEVIVVFNEVDRAAKRLEALTEQRRERIREMTRQKAVEEEISEVSSSHMFLSNQTQVPMVV